MLLVLGLFAVAGVVVLGMMAQRYGSILERQADAQERVERRVAAPRDPARPPGLPRRQAVAEATLGQVDAFICARHEREEGAAPTDEALARCGLERPAYAAIEREFLAWAAGADGVSERLRVAFGQRREELAGSDP
jgi:hypothetical protein